jgi:predicted Na+-dependent transporter
MPLSVTDFRLWIEKNANAIFFAAIGLGFVAPCVNMTPDWVVMALLATVMLFGCAKITLVDLKDLSLRTSIWFYLVRYFLMPALFFFALKNADFSIAVAALLILLAPSGVVAPAITGLVEGNIAFRVSLRDPKTPRL